MSKCVNLTQTVTQCEILTDTEETLVDECLVCIQTALQNQHLLFFTFR